MISFEGKYTYLV